MLVVPFVVMLAILAFLYCKRSSPQIVKVNSSQDYVERLSEWVEILNEEERVWARGKRVSWLPPESFGDGACLLTGVIDLTGTVPELRTVIDREFAPHYIDENCLVARMLVAAREDERLVLGSIDDVVVQNKIASLCAASHVDREVYVQISSDSISPLIAKNDRETFERIWSQYA